MSVKAIAPASTRFAFKLFGELAQPNRAANIFISPLSIGLALAMAYNGACGETQRAITTTMELSGLSLDELNEIYAELVRSLVQSDPQVRLAIANSLWARQGLTFDQEFSQRTRKFYQAESEQLDFSDPHAAATINAWVERSTAGKIRKIVDQIGPDALLFLINAIYFKGDWARPFDKRRTSEQTFTLSDGKQKRHPLMAQSGKFDYYAGQGFQAVSLPYGAGRLCMYIFLPEQRSSLDAFLQNLDPKRWDDWMRHFRETEGSLVLPRFKLEYEATLNDALKALGMGVAFSPHADFSAMFVSEPRVCIDEVKHKTFVEVNEEGTEAAAVTSIGMMRASFIPNRSFSMVVDRPFFCAIRDTQMGTLLFLGSITDPR